MRYTYIDGLHLACKISSQNSLISNVDYRRYDLAHTPYEKIQAPNDIIQKVNLLMNEMGLKYAALDFIVTPKNEWIFLEANCFGQWLWIETLSGLNISDEIVKWLEGQS
ncbi:hypothetical protein [Campylobacter sp. MIT 99-7217]|uniref:hypothetical protein n=1 Tax=Campylobacter sp. MIT 99-7217 TaxID=535091 RepID=UPI00115B2E76|nr:hypothetical protein [Campylobacter sp. MIT 99-7217]